MGVDASVSERIGHSACPVFIHVRQGTYKPYPGHKLLTPGISQQNLEERSI
jgi:hypothetical protein